MMAYILGTEVEEHNSSEWTYVLKLVFLKGMSMLE